MPRPEERLITFTLDGQEVQAVENSMLVDAAKRGDVEIPVFCYEPKLGKPVGACRMCLVEIEGIPKLQTGCSTPVKDGMVVHTQTDRVKTAQQAVVEFLLINHPLDCPVCDKGGECPLQDITFGWGGGISRFIEPKRHFRKPLELSPLIAIDRERCILCYRCVRFSQEIAEDYQLVLLERGAHSYVATFDGHPYVAPFSGNIVELCPVGALTSRPYRFRARPWDIEGAGSVCTLCPAQCNVTFTVRDERVLRVLGRDHPAVDDGWLCDKGRFAYQAIHADERITQPLLRDGGELRPVSWERALDEAAAALRRARGSAAGIAGGNTSNEEALLLSRLLREALDSPDVDGAGGVDPRAAQLVLDPELAASVPDIEFADTVLVLGTEPVDDAPIIDLRIRKGVRRNHVKLAVATARPSSLDQNATLSLRIAPGEELAFLQALAAALYGGEAAPPERGVSHPDADSIRALGDLLRTGGEDVVIVWGERLLGAGGPAAAQALVKIAAGCGARGRDGAGLLGIPTQANGRGVLEAGFAPGCGPGFTEAPAGRDVRGIAEALADGELAAVYLMHVDPLLSLSDRPMWEQALDRASTIIAHAEFLTETVREHATVVFPAETHAEKEGTVTHPDGRLQRLRPAIKRVGDVRATWSVLADLGRRVDCDLGVRTGPMATAQLADAVPFYAGLTLEELAGRGVRWQEREAASAWPAAAGDAAEAPSVPLPAPASDGALRLGTYRSVWAAPEVEHSPALKFLHPRQRLEISPADAERLGLREGEHVEVARHGGFEDGDVVRATVSLRASVPTGAVFLEEGLPAQAANALTNGGGPVAVQVRPYVELVLTAVGAEVVEEPGEDPAAEADEQ
jgi:NADH-quinone oxidoreductase subunit G